VSDLPLRRDGPELDGAVPGTGGEELAVARERHGLDASGISASPREGARGPVPPLRRARRPPGTHIPQPHDPSVTSVVASRGENPAVGGEGEGTDKVLMALEGGQLPRMPS